MSVVGSLAKAAAGAKVLRHTTLTTRVFPKSKGMMVVALAVVGLALVIPASQAPSAEPYSSSVGTKDYQSATKAAGPVSESGAAPQMSEQEAIDAYRKLPLSFIPNEGQTEEAVRYYAQGAGYGFFFTHKGATLSFAEGKGRGHALALKFLGADPDATLTAEKRLSGEVNYLVGDDPAKWEQRLPTHGELLYGGLWPGIDMTVRGEGGKLKYEFHLKPGSSVEDVRLAYRGSEGLSVGTRGELLVQTSLGVIKDAAPVSYQLIGGERVAVESRYRLTGDGGYGFAVGTYDPRYPLVIDPGLHYSTFLGGTNDVSGDIGSGIAVDGEGRAYVTGSTSSTDYPTTTGAFDRTFEGGDFSGDAFVTKLNASGSALVYSTFLGGTNDDGGSNIAVRDTKAYVTGSTSSTDYPTTTGAFDRTFEGGDFSGDAFVTKLNASGSALVYSTFLGGTGFDEGISIAVDGEDRAYVTGYTESTDYPTTRGAFDTSYGGAEDVFVTKLNASGSALVYSTFLGGMSTDGDVDWDVGYDIAVRDGRAYVTGLTEAEEYPTTRGAFDRTFNDSGGQDAFVTKLNASGSALDYSTFLGGGAGQGIAVDGRGRAYVTGVGSKNYPTTPGAFDTTSGGAYVTKLNASGSKLAYSTFLGGGAGQGIAVRDGRAYVTGYTTAADYPTTTGAFDRTFEGGDFSGDAFVTKLNASGSALAYSTFLGGTNDDGGSNIAVDRSGSAYVTGLTASTDYPTTSGAFDRIFNGPNDVFVTKLPTG